MRRRGFERREVLKMGSGLALGAAVSSCMLPPLPVSETRSSTWSPRPARDAGMSASGLSRLGSVVQDNIDKGLIAGAVTAVCRHNQLVFLEARGMADLDEGRPLQTDALFRMMSSTKPVTAVAVLMAIEDGKLGLDDPVSRYIPAFRNQLVLVAAEGETDPGKFAFEPAHRDITVRDLLTHTSGLSSTPGTASVLNSAERGQGATLASVVPQFGKFVLDFQPGSRWGYSPLDGMDTLLHIVEIVSGMPADRFLRERLFAPLQMADTGFSVPPSKSRRMAGIYTAEDGRLEPRPWLLADLPATYISGAGGLISTARDMMQFELMLMNQGSFGGARILKPETVALMSQNHVGNLFADWIPFMTKGFGFGLGVRVLQDPAHGHGWGPGAFGWGGAYGTETWADPALGIAGVLLIQMDPPPLNLRREVSTAIRDAIVA